MIPNRSAAATPIPLSQAAALTALEATRYSQSENMVICPACGTDYVHLVGSGVRGQTDLTLITGDGLHFVSGLPDNARGSAVITLYWCEGEDVFARIERFYKGQTFITTAILPGLDSLPTLWRD